jgi:predicted N-acyltransferase
MDVRWSSFDDYLKSLESHKTRNAVRREIKKCTENGVATAEEKDFGDLSMTLAELYSNLFRNTTKV